MPVGRSVFLGLLLVSGPLSGGCKCGAEHQLNVDARRSSTPAGLTQKPTRSAKALDEIPSRVGPIERSAWLTAHFSDPKASGVDTQLAELSAEACGVCHKEQFADWKGSRHARAMGPGVHGQLLRYAAQAKAKKEALCQSCHAPLAEQATFKGATGSESLRQEGVTCVVCHMRDGKIHGPKGLTVSPDNIHGPGASQPDFKSPGFCGTCHNFGAHGKSLNHKLMEETVDEWRRTRFAADGLTCQGCHMPGGRHLFLGIHDKEMVRSGVEVRFELSGPKPGEAASTLSVENLRVGHRFPTYSPPQILLVIEQIDSLGVAIPGTQERTAIGRRVSVDLRREEFDNRLLPGESSALHYRQSRREDAVALEGRVEVWPDEGYRRLFLAILLKGVGDKEAEGELRAALKESKASRYLLTRHRLKL